MALFITNNNNITNFETTYHVLLSTELNKSFSAYGNLKKQISQFAQSQSFEGNFNESFIFNEIDNEKSSSKKFIGLGTKKDLTNEKIFRCASSITYSIVSSKQKISSLQIVLPNSFDNIKIDKNSNEEVERFINRFNSKTKREFNKITFKNFINRFFLAYSG